MKDIKTFAELKKAGFHFQGIKEELRKNLIQHIEKGSNPFEGIYGFDDTVIPEIQNAILSKHNILLLGLRGQAKTKIARLLVNLLDEYIPFIEGTELFEDPFAPISNFGKSIIAEKGDKTPIAWMHRLERYGEKLATPDVTVSDLIGDIDPIKAATLKLPYSDPRVIHYGIIPRSNRGIFVINEIPDLQPRIQVSLLNILQEGDIQIRGYKMRLPLDIQFVFTANPEDYTNRGSIITPLKDRIESQILTHYPDNIEISKSITKQEVNISDELKNKIEVDPILENLIENIAIESRNNEYVDKKSGVSARLTISAYENLFSSIERRMLKNKEKKGFSRVADLWATIPSITGKIELVYEGEQEGAYKVAQILIGKAIKKSFLELFPDTQKSKKNKQETNPYSEIQNWFAQGNSIHIDLDDSEKDYKNKLISIPGLEEITKKYHSKVSENQKYLYMELVLHGLSEFSMLNKSFLKGNFEFKDMFSSIFSEGLDEDDFDDLNPNNYK